MLKIEDFQKSKLVEIGWRFSQYYNSGHVGAQMIMSTIANRQRAGWGSWLEVMNQLPQYMAENELPPLVYPSVWDGTFVKLLHVVDGVYEGSAKDTSCGALYWGDLTKIERPWFMERIIQATKENGERQHSRCADMNSLSFWR